ncbi:MAG: YafY family transcriptional regulator [Nonomuraea sp.]|nr:YafY family transcriptional regulator [Nonomuraea sp.]NUP77140.1 YafY family transcriptional regulator [Nonomuraea sp.]
MLETSVRLLRLLALLQSRPGWSGAELADRLGVTTRTVRNDVERLRVLGYRVHSTTGTAGGYRLGAGAALPPLLLDEEEAVAVAVSLHAAASGSVTGIEETSLRALAKLQKLLPARLRHRTEAVGAATVSPAGRGPQVSADTLLAVAATIRDHEQLRFDYLGHDGTGTVRAVEPHRLVYTGRRWYLLAWDPSRDDWRTFRADRIRPRTPNGPRFTPREPPGGDAVEHVVRGTASTAYRHRAVVRLHAPAASLAERLPPAAGLLREDGEHACVLETGSADLHDLASFIGGLGVPFTVVETEELRDHLRTLAARYAEAAGRSPVTRR